MNTKYHKICCLLSGIVLVVCSLCCIFLVAYSPVTYLYDPVLCVSYVMIMYYGISYVYAGLYE